LRRAREEAGAQEEGRAGAQESAAEREIDDVVGLFEASIDAAKRQEELHL